MESVGVAWRCRSVHNLMSNALECNVALRCVRFETCLTSMFSYGCITLEKQESACIKKTINRQPLIACLFVGVPSWDCSWHALSLH